MISRRRSLALLGASALALPFALSAGPARAASRKRPEVIVIGAGLSGLQAALLLEAGDAKVQILEARDRVGGRCHTLDTLPGHPEAGASRISAQASRVRALCGGLGVALEPVPAESVAPALCINGVTMGLGTWPTSPANRLEGLARQQPPQYLARYLARNVGKLDNPAGWRSAVPELDDIRLDLYLRGFGATEEALRLVGAAMPSEKLHELSALALARRAALEMEENAGRADIVAGGMSRLPEAMFKAVKGKVRFGSRVAAIDWTGEEVRVTCVPEKAGKKGKVYKGSHVILAVPVGVLQDIAFIPGLPDPLGDAIRDLTPAPVARILFRTMTPYWKADGLPASMWTDGLLGRLSTAAAPAGPDGAPGGWIVSCTVRGERALRLGTMTPEAQAEACKAELVKIRPSLADAEFLQVAAWSGDPLAGGDGILWAPGQMRKYGHAFATPAGPLFFAGADASIDADGLEGALASGEAAARQILALPA